MSTRNSSADVPEHLKESIPDDAKPAGPEHTEGVVPDCPKEDSMTPKHLTISCKDVELGLIDLIHTLYSMKDPHNHLLSKLIARLTITARILSHGILELTGRDEVDLDFPQFTHPNANYVTSHTPGSIKIQVRKGFHGDETDTPPNSGNRTAKKEDPQA